MLTCNDTHVFALKHCLAQEWPLRPFYPRSNILGRLPNCVSENGTLVTPVVGMLGSVNIKAIAGGVNKDEIAEVSVLYRVIMPHAMQKALVCHVCGSRMPMLKMRVQSVSTLKMPHANLTPREHTHTCTGLHNGRGGASRQVDDGVCILMECGTCKHLRVL